jgi:hypothetical protein
MDLEFAGHRRIAVPPYVDISVGFWIGLIRHRALRLLNEVKYFSGFENLPLKRRITHPGKGRCPDATLITCLLKEQPLKNKYDHCSRFRPPSSFKADTLAMKTHDVSKYQFY